MSLTYLAIIGNQNVEYFKYFINLLYLAALLSIIIDRRSRFKIRFRGMN